MARALAAAPAAAVAAVSVSLACGANRELANRPISRETETELAIARAATIPKAIRLVESSAPARQGLLVLAQWSFHADDGWEAYSSRAASELQSAGYRMLKTVDGVFGFAKDVPGDVYRLQIEQRGPGSPTRVLVRFSASPD